MKSVCVFCGSGKGNQGIYRIKAQELGLALAKTGLKLVYGGASVGLMGAIANTMLKNGGYVTGIMPHDLVKREVAHDSLTEMKVVDNMHERKMLMHEHSDGFIAMPGGFGTMDEIFEALTWGQLEIHRKPCAFYNINGYYDSLFDFIRLSVNEGFVNAKHLEMIIIEDNPKTLLAKMSCYTHPNIDKADWIKSSN